jgi:flagellar motor switch protein FliG
MGEISRALGNGSTLQFRGKTYRLAPWSYDIQAEFEQHLEQKAWETYLRATKCLPKEEVDALRAQTSRDITAGVYSFGAQVSVTSLSALPHLKHLVWMLLEREHPEVTPMLVQEMLQEDQAEVFRAIDEANADPFGKKPAAAAST